MLGFLYLLYIGLLRGAFRDSKQLGCNFLQLFVEEKVSLSIVDGDFDEMNTARGIIEALTQPGYQFINQLNSVAFRPIRFRIFYEIRIAIVQPKLRKSCSGLHALFY